MKEPKDTGERIAIFGLAIGGLTLMATTAIRLIAPQGTPSEVAFGFFLVVSVIFGAEMLCKQIVRSVMRIREERARERDAQQYPDVPF